MDPALFGQDAVDAETAAWNAELEDILGRYPAIWESTPEEAREAREAGHSAFGPIVISDRATQREIPGPAGPLTVRLVLPAEIHGVYLHLHGGGWVLGAAHHQDSRLEAIADACSLAVLSLEYRLAPEHPHPAAADDCLAAAEWLVENAAGEFGTGRLLIGGESAGAHLSVLTLLRLRARHGGPSFAGANLAFGVYDLRLSPSARRWGERNLVLNTPLMTWFVDHYVPPRRRQDPDVSPLLADLGGLPPALFSVGTLDPLLDDTLFMHARWVAAGNEAELAVYPGACHGFDAFPTEVGRTATARIHAFLDSPDRRSDQTST